jgi:hypothetical protein
LPAVVNELATLGMARGAKFDEIVEQVFAIQLTGRGKTMEEREKILRKLSGIKEVPKKKEKEKKPAKGGAKPVKGAEAALVPEKAASAGGKTVTTKAEHRDRMAARHAAKPAAPAAHGKSGAASKKSSGRK